MRTLIAFTAFATTVWPSLGQGTVDFRNQSSVLGTNNDYLVRLWTGDWIVPLTGTEYVAQLYYGPVGSDSWSFAPVPGTANFRLPTTALPGTWSGGGRTVPAPYGPGGITSVALQVRVWSSAYATSWEDAMAKSDLAHTGASHVFTFNFFASSPPLVTDDDMVNFRGFIVGSPEPSSAALLAIGALGLCLFRRK